MWDEGRIGFMELMKVLMHHSIKVFCIRVYFLPLSALSIGHAPVAMREKMRKATSMNRPHTPVLT